MDSQRLHILWTSGDRQVALKVVFMYAHNSLLKKWWNSVHLIVWGPSAKLLAEDMELQAGIKAMKASGVEVSACKRCADEFAVADCLLQLGVDVKYMGEPLTNILQDGEKLITF